MASNFEFYSPTRVIFGKGTEQRVGALVREYGGTRVLVVYGGKSAIRSGVLDRAEKSLAEAGLSSWTLGGVVPNPHLDKVYEGIRIGRENGIDFLLAVGGGSVIDTAKAIAEKLGLELQIDDMDVVAALRSVQQGKADIVMAGVTVTDERKAVMDFSDSYATGIQSIIVPEGSDIASPDDLAGKTIGTQRGTTGYIYCSDDFGDDAVVAYDDGLTAVQALNNGQVDAVVIDNAPAKEFVAANPGLGILDTSYAEEDYAIGLAKGSALEDAVNAALEELKADGTLQSIVDKYITAE